MSPALTAGTLIEPPRALRPHGSFKRARPSFDLLARRSGGRGRRTWPSKPVACFRFSRPKRSVEAFFGTFFGTLIGLSSRERSLPVQSRPSNLLAFPQDIFVSSSPLRSARLPRLDHHHGARRREHLGILPAASVDKRHRPTQSRRFSLQGSPRPLREERAPLRQGDEPAPASVVRRGRGRRGRFILVRNRVRGRWTTMRTPRQHC